MVESLLGVHAEGSRTLAEEEGNAAPHVIDLKNVLHRCSPEARQ
jgi:hypothetical protein